MNAILNCLETNGAAVDNYVSDTNGTEIFLIAQNEAKCHMGATSGTEGRARMKFYNPDQTCTQASASFSEVLQYPEDITQQEIQECARLITGIYDYFAAD